ncbi:MAG TPA: hypothetical protein VHN99_05760, partial [Deinococcales bacterium]|nr:hypothetical protein [Deinococcales bacterium]
LAGPPRAERTLADLEPFAGLWHLEVHHGTLRVNRLELRRVALSVDRLFTALEFQVVGRPLSSVRPLGPLAEGQPWRAPSLLWSCYRPLEV